MKFKTILSAGMFAAIAALSMGAQAASDTDKATAAKAPAAGTQADQKMKSHMQEKTGNSPPALPVAASEGKSSKVKAGQSKDKHYHPRDGKS